MAAALNEPDVRVDARVLVLAGESRIKESTAAPGRWILACPASSDGDTAQAAKRTASASVIPPIREPATSTSGLTSACMVAIHSCAEQPSIVSELERVP